MTKTATLRNTLAGLAVAVILTPSNGLLAQDYIGYESGIAGRYIAQLYNNMESARAAIDSGDVYAREKDWENATLKYREAVDLLPDAPNTQSLRQPAVQRYNNASLKYADQLARQGKFEQAQGYLDQVLALDPENAEARKMAKNLYDPQRYPIAATERHADNIERVTKHLQMAWSAYDLARFDEANEQFKEVLRLDRYNTAARRGMEQVEKKKMEYHLAARDHTRAAMLDQVSAAWETPVPSVKLDAGPTVAQGPTAGDNKTYIVEKLNRIQIDRLSLTDASLMEAVEFLRTKAKAADLIEPDPNRKGVDIIVKNPEKAGTATINLNVENVPLAEALRYVTELAGMKYKVDPYAVVIVPITESGEEMIIRTWQVPPDFTNAGGDGGGAGGAAPDDPFAPAGGGVPASGLGPTQRITAKDVLTQIGVTFPDGSSATYNSGTSTLTVRNTPQMIDAIDNYVAELYKRAPRQIMITTKFVEVSQRNTDELGFDWLLGPLAIGSKGAFGSGGTIGNSSNVGDSNGGNYPFETNGVPIGGNPVTQGIRFGTAGIVRDTIDGLISGTGNPVSLSPGIFSIAGIFTDPQFQVVVRGLSQKKGVDLMTAPSVTTRSGQRATIEVIREFIYPIEFEPPEVPQNFGNNQGGGGNINLPGGGVGNGQVNSFPVTPTTPTAFDTRKVGVSMEVDPVLGPDNQTIDLTLAPEVVEFEGFINYGSPIQAAAVNALGQPTTVILTPNTINQPIFSTRKVQTSVTIWDGQTVALGGLMREDVQIIDDKVPILGDIPLIGRLFQNKAEETYKRNLMIFVTCKIIDPSGQALRPPNENLEDLNQYLDRGSVPPDFTPAPAPYYPSK
jgi:general secretion pathway protein D